MTFFTNLFSPDTYETFSRASANFYDDWGDCAGWRPAA